MKKIIKLNHHVDDYECMWNGIEDIYMNQTGEKLPDNFFFLLSGFGTFCYMRTNKAELKRMVALGDGRTKKMYEFLSPIIGLEYKFYSYEKHANALKKAKDEIDNGFPVVLGALDMYYLPYFKKIYKKEHIPFHYVLMVGYDDSKQVIYLYDCGRSELLSLSYESLEKAANCSYPGLSKENTICTIRLNTDKSKYQIAKEALRIRKEEFLNPLRSFLGYKGFEKFIEELPKWKDEIGKAEYDKILKNMVMFFGTVPTLPNKLRGVSEPDSVVFRGSFDKMSKMLISMGAEYQNDSFLKSAKLFEEAGLIIEKISRIIINYLLDETDDTILLPTLFKEVLSKMESAYCVMDLQV